MEELVDVTRKLTANRMVRSGPGLNYPVINKIKAGTVVHFTKMNYQLREIGQQSWRKIAGDRWFYSPHYEGWVSLEEYFSVKG